MRKIGRILLVFILSLTLVACAEDTSTTSSAAKTNNKEFDTFVEKLPNDIFDDTDYSLNYFFVNKEDFGYKDVLYELKLDSFKDYKEAMKQTKETYEKIEEFDRSALSKNQQITYDVLRDAYDVDDSDMESSYYLTTNPLDYNYGHPGSLPIELYFFNLRNKSDVDSYLNLLKTCTSFYEKAATFEQERQDKGFGMTPSHIALVEQQCADFIKADKSFLISSFDEKIDVLDFLSDEEKSSYKEQNKTFVENDFTNAYTTLQTKLKELDVKAKDEGLHAYNNGEEYFEGMIHENTGFDDIEDYREYIEEQSDYYFEEMYRTSSAVPNGVDESGNFYTDAKDPNEVLKELEEKTKDDFPELRSLDYEMKIVPESMRPIISASAMYFVSPVDDKNVKEYMALNGDYSAMDFTTIAHEGYPGHMYQTQYYKEQDQPVIRNLLGYGGYTEGYANYVENYSAKYAKDPKIAEAISYNQQYMYANMLLVDIMIHNDGASKKEVFEFMDEFSFGSFDDLTKEEVYNQLLNSPTIFSKYYGAGFRLFDLKETVKEEIGDDFSDKDFHKAILDVGPAPYEVVETYVLNTLTK